MLYTACKRINFKLLLTLTFLFSSLSFSMGRSPISEYCGDLKYQETRYDGMQFVLSNVTNEQGYPYGCLFLTPHRRANTHTRYNLNPTNRVFEESQFVCALGELGAPPIDSCQRFAIRDHSILEP